MSNGEVGSDRPLWRRAAESAAGLATGFMVAGLAIAATAAGVEGAEYMAGDQLPVQDALSAGGGIVGVAALAGTGVFLAIRHHGKSAE